MPSVNVTINGKNYRMACDEGQEEHLLALAAKFDGFVDQLKGSFGEIGDQRLTVMAGVMVTDKVDELEEKMLSESDKQRTEIMTKEEECRRRERANDSLIQDLKNSVSRLTKEREIRKHSETSQFDQITSDLNKHEKTVIHHKSRIQELEDQLD